MISTVRIVSYGLILLWSGFEIVADELGWGRIRTVTAANQQEPDTAETIQLPFYAWNFTTSGYNDMLECPLRNTLKDDIFLCRQIVDHCLQYFESRGIGFDLGVSTWRVYSPPKSRFYVLEGDCSEVYDGTFFEFGQYRPGVTDLIVDVRIVRAREIGNFHDVSTCPIRNTFASRKCGRIMHRCNITKLRPIRISDEEGDLMELSHYDICRGVYSGDVIFTDVKMDERIVVTFCPLRKHCRQPREIAYNVASTPRAIFDAHFPLDASHVSPAALRVYMSAAPDVVSVPCPLDSLFRVSRSNRRRYQMEIVEVGHYGAGDVDIPLD